MLFRGAHLVPKMYLLLLSSHGVCHVGKTVTSVNCDVILLLAYELFCH